MSAIIFHGLERLLINIGAIFIAYLGYKLFIYGVEKGHAKLEAHSPAFKIVFSGSSPGLFFMVSGLIILVVSLVTGKVEIYERETRRGKVTKVSSGITNKSKSKKPLKKKPNYITESEIFRKLNIKATSSIVKQPFPLYFEKIVIPEAKKLKP